MAVAQGKPAAAQTRRRGALGHGQRLEGKQFALFDELESLVPGGIYKARVSFKMGIHHLWDLSLTWRKEMGNRTELPS